MTARPGARRRQEVAGVLLLLGAPTLVLIGWLVTYWIGGPNAFIGLVIVAAVMFVAGIVLTRAWSRPEVPVRVDAATGTTYRDVRVEFGKKE